MNGSLLQDAFGHHVWATVTLIDACLKLDPLQLETAVPGTYGSIIETMRHTVGADASYLYVLQRRRAPEIDEDAMDLPALREVMVAIGPAWDGLLARTWIPRRSSCATGTTGRIARAPLRSASPRRSTTAPTTGARSARRSRAWASSRRRSMPGTTLEGWPPHRDVQRVLTRRRRLQPAG